MANAIVLACGIMMVVVPSIIFNTFWGFAMILVFAASLVFPLLCNGYAISESDAWLFESEDDAQTGAMLGWTLLGATVTVGYAIPFEVWRVGGMSPVAMGLAMGGGTVILAAVGVFGKIVSDHKRENE